MPIDSSTSGTDVMVVEHWPTDRLIPYARNPRQNEESVASVAASIREFGFRQPIVVDEDNVILVGHTRLKAAQRLGMVEVPVHVARNLTPSQRKAYRIMDNRAGHASEWDTELLSLEIDDLRADGFDIDLTGFSDGDLAGMLNMDDDPDFEPGTEEDQGKLDELAPKWVTCPHCGQEFDSREQG